MVVLRILAFESLLSLPVPIKPLVSDLDLAAGTLAHQKRLPLVPEASPMSSEAAGRCPSSNAASCSDFTVGWKESRQRQGHAPEGHNRRSGMITSCPKGWRWKVVFLDRRLRIRGELGGLRGGLEGPFWNSQNGLGFMLKGDMHTCEFSSAFAVEY